MLMGSWDICLTEVEAGAVPVWPARTPPAPPDRQTTTVRPRRVGTPRPPECPLSLPAPRAARAPAGRVLESGEEMELGGGWGECCEG